MQPARANLRLTERLATVPSLPSTKRGLSPTNRLDLWLERQPIDNYVTRAVDRRRRNDRLIVEAVGG